ncbi:alpha/beta-hydrolase [Annulohypoxylon maeteangense]|uniref:alpha/beta-hydrolase n=1 Tax=Annulohypoxylon maeteangense TaxID=1927788 RepID=UPI002008E953|nr:alpha/beta-hydrolase [Annulohypoxylon maeteangense]KAI0888722.1 alpha/beta-hydrolase [Annulohypoxylon maeteangense]
MSKPVFVLLHGAWHSPKCWNSLISELEKANYRAVAPALPSTGSTPPTPDWSGDVEIIRKTVTDLIQKHDVVVVAHSFSGMTAGTALEGLGKQTTTFKGLKGGVLRLIYITAFLVPEGFQHSPRGTRDNMVPEMKTDLNAGIITIRPEDAKDMFYQDIDDETVAELAKDLRPQSFGSYWSITNYASWRHIPTTYILCTADRPSTVVAAQYLIDTAIASGPNKIEKVIRVDTGHSPFISRPEWTAQTLISEATGGSKFT